MSGGCASWIADRAEHNLDLRNRERLKSPEDDLLELSDADLSVLAEFWAQFGKMGKYEIRDWTHRNCPEWKDPDGSMIPMSLDDLFAALKFTSEQKRATMARLVAESKVNEVFASVKGNSCQWLNGNCAPAPSY